MWRVVLFLQGLIFVVDSNDRERAQEAAEELQKMVRKHPSEMKNSSGFICVPAPEQYNMSEY